LYIVVRTVLNPCGLDVKICSDGSAESGVCRTDLVVGEMV
jgi:hypothetical protein